MEELIACAWDDLEEFSNKVRGMGMRRLGIDGRRVADCPSIHPF